MTEHGHQDDPRFQAGVDFIIAAEAYAVALSVVDGHVRNADKVMRTAQIMTLDTMPVCMYKEVVLGALMEVYPPEIRGEIADEAERVARETPVELSAEYRVQRAEWIRKLREGA